MVYRKMTNVEYGIYCIPKKTTCLEETILNRYNILLKENLKEQAGAKYIKRINPQLPSFPSLAKRGGREAPMQEWKEL